MPKPSLPDARPRLAAPEKPFADWTHADYVEILVAFNVVSPMVAAALKVLCEREKALAVNDALHRVLAPEGENQ